MNLIKINKNKRIVTNIIELDKINKEYLCQKSINKYFKKKNHIDILELNLDNVQSYEIEILYNVSNYDPITWLHKNNLLNKELFHKSSAAIARHIPKLIEKYVDWFDWGSSYACSNIAESYPKLIEKFPDRYNWKHASHAVVKECPYLIHKFNNLFDWKGASSYIIIYAPWLIKKFFDRIDWAQIFEYNFTESMFSKVSFGKMMIRKYLYEIDWSKVFKNLSELSNNNDYLAYIFTNILKMGEKSSNRLVTNLIEFNDLNLSECCRYYEEIKDKYFRNSDIVDISKIDFNIVEVSELRLLYEYTDYGPFEWLHMNNLLRPEYFEKFWKLFVDFPNLRLIAYKYFSKIIRKRRLSLSYACKNATRLLCKKGAKDS